MARIRRIAVDALAMSLAAGVLYALVQALLAAPCWSLFFLVAAVAWPMWLGQREYALFQHRMALVATTREESRVRRWFWRGSVTSAIQMLSALFWAALLLAFGALLDPWHLGLLAADIVVLAIAARYARSLLESDVREEHAGMLSRRWLLMAFNLAFLAASFFAIDYFLVGAPDTRGIAWDAVAERAYEETRASAACPLAGVIVGSLNAADRLNWHAAEVLIPSLPGSGLKLMAWILFLVQAGAVAFAYTRLQLGVLALVERRASPPPESGDRAFPASLAVLAAIYLLGVFALRDFDAAGIAPAGRALVAVANPCRSDPEMVRVLRANLDLEIDRARLAEQARAGGQVDAALESLFGDVEKGVDQYLNWYFSLIGEYTRLAAWAGSRSGDQLQEGINVELERRLFAGRDAGKVLTEANQRIAAHSAAALSALGVQIAAQLQRDARGKPCLLDRIDLPAIGGIERDALRATAAVTSGLAVGAATASVMAGRLSSFAAARLAAKRAVPSAAGVASRLAGRRAGSLLVAAGAGAAACAPGGVLAPLCGIVAGVIAWVTVDQALIKIDELRYREEMRAEILDVVRAQKEELSREMRAVQSAAIDGMAAQVHSATNRVFVPARDGGGVL